MGLRAGALLGMVLWDGMQPIPSLQLDVAILRIVGGPLVGRLRPGRWVVADELGPMPARSARRGLARGIGVEAAARPQAHQQANGLVGQGQAQLNGVVARIEAKDGQWSARQGGRRWREPRADLLGGD